MNPAAGERLKQVFALTTAALQQRRAADAVPLAREAVALVPESADARVMLAAALFGVGDHAAGAAEARVATTLAPQRPDIWASLARACLRLGQLDEAEQAAIKAEQLGPQMPHAIMALAAVRLAQARVGDALAIARRAIAIGPDAPQIPEEFAMILGKSWRIDETLAYARAARARDPRRGWAYMSEMWASLYSATATPHEVFHAHRTVGQHLSRMATPMSGHRNDPDPDRPIRIGVISQDYRDMSAAYFVRPLLAHHDRERYPITCYSSTRGADSYTEYLRTLASAWRDILPMSDDQAAALIVQDNIDVLIDLCGHGGLNRLGIMCRRPAPVQVTFQGYLNTTGIDAIRFRVVDYVTDPTGSEALSTEELLRLDGAFLCYGGPREAPEVAPLPMLSRGQVTFGSFNTLDKITEPVLDAWAAVLRAVYGSRLLLKARALADVTLAARVREEFAKRGVAADQVEALAETPSTREHLGMYSRVDVALDTWPYNGVTTTCEALWMGVPVVAMRGDRHQARVSESFLRAADLSAWIAIDQADFVRIASSLAADGAALAKTRAGLREKVRASSLCDGASKIRQIEAHCRAAWQRWCRERW